jgi:kumamolisin
MADESHNLVQLPGSERTRLEAATPAGQLDTSERAELTLVLRRRAEIPAEIVEGPTVLTHDQLAEQYGADPADVDLVRQTLTGLGLEITEVHASTRRVKVAGTVGALSSAFGVTLQQVSSPDPKTGDPVMHRYREGPLFVPAALNDVVLAVLGLDTRPQARPHFRPLGDASGAGAGARAAAAAPASTYPPNQVADFYKFPAGTTGAGQTIAVIELGGGFATSDLDTYFGSLGIAVPSVSAVSVDGASNAPGSDPNGADVEVALDVDVIGAAAPGAAQVVYFAPNNGDQGFVDAIGAAASATPAPIAISISWGQSEDSWTAQGRSAMDAAIADAAAMGITVCVASGDNGSGDAVTDGQPHVDFPASSPHALACGGTKLVANVAAGTISSEVIWNETAANEGAGGGGISDVFAVPSFQANAGVPARAAGSGSGRGHGSGAAASGGTGTAASGGTGTAASASAAAGGRGVPDVAGNADPVTGYQIFSGGQAQVVGGTSAVAPLWAALVSRLAEATGQRFGLIQTLLYAGVTPGTAVNGFNDITSGNNGAYTAGPGWDACSGLGSPDGTALLARLKS